MTNNDKKSKKKKSVARTFAEAFERAHADPDFLKLTPEQLAILKEDRATEERSRKMPDWLKNMRIGDRLSPAT